jgi:hypothetical protein
MASKRARALASDLAPSVVPAGVGVVLRMVSWHIRGGYKGNVRVTVWCPTLFTADQKLLAGGEQEAELQWM